MGGVRPRNGVMPKTLEVESRLMRVPAGHGIVR
jgi:hypothetical protein